MYKEIYQSAMEKIKAGEGFHEKIQNTISQNEARSRKPVFIRLMPAFLAICVLVYLGVAELPVLFGKHPIQDSTFTSDNNSEDFEIIKENVNEEACYISVFYLYGYAYEPLHSWLRYSYGLSDDTNYEALKGNKLGEVTLDLKGKQYKDTPPDFSSTYDVGTEIYEMKGIRVETGILVKLGESYEPFYRDRKYTTDMNQPIGLTMSDVFHMLSNDPKIVSIELRNEENGAWMQTSEDPALLSLANKELPEKSLLNHGEIEKNPYEADHRIPINLIFADGRALHMQVFPASGIAWAFGGFLPISREFGAAVQSLMDQGSPYPLLSDLIPYTEEEVEYLYLKNLTNGDEIVCETPAWSRSPLFSILSYYRVEATEPEDSQLVMTAILGRSESDSVTVNFFETADGKILTEIKGVYYKPVRGQLLFKSLDNYLYNYTDLGR